jgi:acetyltransferase-like isoleucine patch superfamily enzyme
VFSNVGLSQKIVQFAYRLLTRAEKRLHSEFAKIRIAELKSSLGTCGKGVTINPKWDWLGHSNIHLGNNVYINNGSSIQGEGGLFIGDNTIIGPNVTIWTVNHEIHDEVLPYGSVRRFRPVRIERNVWIGINVTIVPGAHIGEGVVIGAGTVVAGVVPKLAIVAGAKWRLIGERDRRHYEDKSGESLL